MKPFTTLIVPFLLLALTTSPARAAPELSIGQAAVRPGGATSLPINISSVSGQYAGVNARMLLPEGVAPTGVARGDLLSTDFVVSWRRFSDSGGRGVAVIAYSGSDAFGGASGNLFNVQLEVSKTAEIGTHDVAFSSVNPIELINSKYALSNADGSSSVVPLVANGSLVIAAGEFNIADVIVILKTLCGLTPDVGSIKDINGNQKIGLEEAVDILIKIAGM